MAQANTVRRPSRVPGLVHVGLVLLLVAIVIPLLLTSSRFGPPSIAEFAPQAAKPIQEAPQEQSGRFGSTSGAPGGDLVSPSPSPPAAGGVPPTATLLHCVGDPPRQIEDPQSPPCIPYWVGDNGGTTSQGVDRNNVTVVFFNGVGTYPDRLTQDLFKFFNKRFQLYGRKLVPETPNQEQGGDSCPNRQAEADADNTQFHPFAVAGSDRYGNLTGCYTDQVAHDRIVESTVAIDPSTYLAANQPYLWRYTPPMDIQHRVEGAWACRTLAGHDAVYSPDALLRTARRKFGMIVQKEPGPYPYDGSDLRAALKGCGEDLVEEDVTISRTGNDGGLAQYSADTTTAVVQLKSQHVSTVFCDCPVFSSELVASAASSQQYYPEWLMNDYNSTNIDIKSFWPNTDERRSLLLLSAAPEQLHYGAMPVNWALQEVDPGFQVNDATEQGGNTNTAQLVYWTLLLLASGVQMAGPHLTPQALATGLHRTAFPNPTNWIGSGRVSFLDGGYGMIQDYVTGWWSDTASSTYSNDGPGAWCYAAQGARFTPADFQPSYDYFQGPCVNTPPTADRGG